MILADKIMNLRKKNGLSQEELAEKLGVSRQSVSKYEGAQAIPDMDKILKLSRIFGVSTDFLIKDELETVEYLPQDTEDATEQKTHKVSMEMANDFLQLKFLGAKPLAIAAMLCVFSPICLILLAAATEYKANFISENAAAGIGLCILILLVAVAVVIFVSHGIKASKFEFLETETIETEYGVVGMVKEKKEKFQNAYMKYNVIGVTLCICSVIPLFASIAVAENEFVISVTIGALLMLVGIGVYFFMIANVPMSAMNRLLEEADYTRKNKKISKKIDPLTGGYWLVAVAVFLGYSFVTNDWQRSWIVWPVAGVLFPVYHIIIEKLASKE